MNLSVLHQRLARLLPLILVILPAACGCGDHGRNELKGNVTLDGAPLENGYITFRPEDTTPGPTAGGEVTHGKYLVQAQKGVFAGRFRVEITASRPSKTKAPVPDELTGKLVPTYEQFLPARFNSESKLKADVTGQPDDEFNFAVESK